MTILSNLKTVRFINKKDYNFSCKLNLIVLGVFLFIFSICLIVRYNKNLHNNLHNNNEMDIYSVLLFIFGLIFIIIGCFTIEKKYEMYDEI